ncbi:MAG: FAD-dependent oxidoreductase [Pirellulaceae bacterium]
MSQTRGSVIVLGGGVVGLSIAYELAGRGWRTTVIDRIQQHPSASWAGAGILMPYNSQASTHPMEQLCAISNSIHAQWHQQFLSESGINNEYRICGGVYLARSVGELGALVGQEDYWRSEQIRFETLDPNDLGPTFGFIADQQWKRVTWLPDEAQVRNTRHLAALRAGINSRGSSILETKQTPKIVQGDSTWQVELESTTLQADYFCLSAESGPTKLQLR